MKRAAAFRPGSREPAHPRAAWDLKYRRPERLLVERSAKTCELPRPGLNRPVPVAGAGEAVAQNPFHPTAKVLALREVLDRPSRNGSWRVFPLLPRYSRSANAGCSICPYSRNGLRSSQFNNAGFVRAAEWEKPETDSRHVPFYGLYNGDVLEKPNTDGRAEGG